MKVLVLGSGVIGVTSAYQLALAGHEVTVVDRQPAAALETSYGNAGEVSPGYSAPWAGPGVPIKAIKWLLMQHRPLVIRPTLDLNLVRWGVAMLRNCTAARYELNKGRMVRLVKVKPPQLHMRECRERFMVVVREVVRSQIGATQRECDPTPPLSSVIDGVPPTLPSPEPTKSSSRHRRRPARETIPVAPSRPPAQRDSSLD